MIRDKFDTFSDRQAITAAAASTHVKDLRAVNRQLGIGENLNVIVAVTTAFTDAGSDSTLAVIVQSDDAEGFGSPTTRQTLFTIPALAAVGDLFVARLQPFQTPEQFIRLFYTPAGGDLSTGSVSAWLAGDAQLWRALPIGYVIAS
jgi:hypothetical protein